MFLLEFWTFFTWEDQKYEFTGTIGYGDSYLEFLFRLFKNFKLHPIVDKTARAVTAHSGEGPTYWYKVGRGPNSCLLSLVTGLLFCLYVKLFPLSIFNYFDF